MDGEFRINDEDGKNNRIIMADCIGTAMAASGDDIANAIPALTVHCDDYGVTVVALLTSIRTIDGLIEFLKDARNTLESREKKRRDILAKATRELESMDPETKRKLVEGLMDLLMKGQ